MADKDHPGVRVPLNLLRQLFVDAVGHADPRRFLPAKLPELLPEWFGNGAPPFGGRLIVVGAGKAAASMAQAVEQALPAGRTLSGVVVTRPSASTQWYVASLERSRYRNRARTSSAGSHAARTRSRSSGVALGGTRQSPVPPKICGLRKETSSFFSSSRLDSSSSSAGLTGNGTDTGKRVKKPRARQSCRQSLVNGRAPRRPQPRRRS